MSLLSSLVGGVVWAAVVILSIAGVGAGQAHAQDCDQAEVARLLADDGVEEDHLGWSVAIDGDTAVIGAIGVGDNAWFSGAAYVFVRSDRVWIQQAKLLADDGGYRDQFGYSVSIDGDTIVIGAIWEGYSGRGSAYVFVRDDGVWTQQAKLRADDAGRGDDFGWSVSIDGDTALIGSHLDDDNGRDSGSAYVFTRIGDVWTQQAKLLPDDGEANDWFGVSVSLDGDTALIGAAWDDDNGYASGSAYVFIRVGGVWTQRAKILPDDGGVGDWFGYSVSLEGDTAVIGAHRDAVFYIYSGSAYVFTRSGGGGEWTQQAKLVPDDGTHYDMFGHSVFLEGDTAVIGADYAGDNGAGTSSTYVFARSGGVWTEQAKLLAGDRVGEDRSGQSISLSGNTAVIGVPRDDDNGYRSGSVFVFDLGCNACPADLNGDGIVDTRDFIAFLGAWSSGDPLADWNGDGDVNTLDFLAYLADWVAGC